MRELFNFGLKKLAEKKKVKRSKPIRVGVLR